MDNRTDKQHLVEVLLGRSISEYAAERRPEMSWARISQDLRDDTGLFVSQESLRLWCRETEQAA
jgi:hypothetical protein